MERKKTGEQKTKITGNVGLSAKGGQGNFHGGLNL